MRPSVNVQRAKMAMLEAPTTVSLGARQANPLTGSFRKQVNIVPIESLLTTQN